MAHHERGLSVVVPAYDEADNIRPLALRLCKAAQQANLTLELIIADDESPGSQRTKQICKQLQQEGHEVKLMARTAQMGRGLSSAVLLGFRAAKHQALLCMDADLQHEPEAVPSIAAPILQGKADFAVGSRHVGGGGLGFDWSMSRRVISAVATLLAAPLTTSTDPMSGFFCLSKETLARGDDASINPMGFKIGLELMVRCNCKRVVDVPITFQERITGESKLSSKQNFLYLQQLFALYTFKYGFVVLFLPIAMLSLSLGLVATLSSVH